MLTFTDAAAAHLYELKKELPLGQSLRLYNNGKRLGLKWDKEKPDDYIVSHAETTVLVYDAQLAEMLSDKLIDVKPTDKGSVLALS